MREREIEIDGVGNQRESEREGNMLGGERVRDMEIYIEVGDRKRREKEYERETERERGEDR